MLPLYQQRPSTIAIDAVLLAILPQIAHINYTQPQKKFFVPHRDPSKPLAATLTTTSPAKIKIAHGSTFATAAEVSTQDQLAQLLKDNFNALPVRSNTPINISTFEKELRFHPNRSFVDQLICSLSNGFSIGYSGPELSNVARNLSSTAVHPSVITQSLIEELKLKRMAGPFTSPPLQNFRTSPIGVVINLTPNCQKSTDTYRGN